MSPAATKKRGRSGTTNSAVSVVTRANGGRGWAIEATFQPPEAELGANEAAAFAGSTTLSGETFVDVLSAFLAHERDGVHLYRTVAGRTSNASFRKRYAEFGAETERHIAVYEKLVQDLGGDPRYVSPAARMTECQNAKTLEALLLGGSIDAATDELAMVEAVVTAETKCHANWTFLQELAGELRKSKVREAIQRAVDEVMGDEDDHLHWSTTARTKLLRKLVLA